jgi:hypothetical protein
MPKSEFEQETARFARKFEYRRTRQASQQERLLQPAIVALV